MCVGVMEKETHLFDCGNSAYTANFGYRNESRIAIGLMHGFTGCKCLLC